MRILTIAAAAAAVAATPLIAQTNSNPPDPDRVICKNQRTTGTRLQTNRVCMTKRQWDDLNESANRTAQDAIMPRPTPGGN